HAAAARVGELLRHHRLLRRGADGFLINQNPVVQKTSQLVSDPLRREAVSRLKGCVVENLCALWTRKESCDLADVPVNVSHVVSLCFRTVPIPNAAPEQVVND